MQQSAVVSGQLPSGVGEYVDFTSPGLGTVTAAIIFGNKTTSLSASDDAVLSLGLFDGTRQSCISYYSRDNVGTTETASIQSTGSCIIFCDSTGVESSFTCSGIMNGVRISVQNEFPANQNCSVHLFSGPAASGGTFAVPNLIGFSDTIGTSFTPQFAIFATTNQTNFQTYEANGLFSFGIAKRDGPSHCVTMSSDDNLGTTLVNQRFATNKIAQGLSNDSLDWTAEVTDWSLSGIEITNNDGVSSSPDLMFLIFESGAKIDMGNVSTTAGGGTTEYLATTDTPETAILCMSTTDGSGTLETSSDTNESMSIGMAQKDGDQLTFTINDADNQNPSDTQSIFSTGEMANVDYYSLGFTTLVNGSATSFNSSGVDLFFGTGPLSSRYGFWFAFLNDGIPHSTRQFVTDMSLIGTPGYYYGDFSPKDVQESISGVRYRRHLLYSL